MSPTNDPLNEKPEMPELEDEDQKALRIIEELESENNPNNAELEPVISKPLEVPTRVIPYPVETAPSIDGVSEVPQEPIEEPVEEVIEPIEIIEEPKEEKIVAPALVVPQTPMAAAMASALEEEAPVAEPLIKQKKKSRIKLFVVIGSIVILAALAFAGYLFWQTFQVESPTEAVQQTGSGTSRLVEAPANADTEASVTETATSTEAEINALDDTPYDDSMLSDKALYEN